ncbi:hypothetical protein [Asaia bogorensis]|uniref:hypothetical protein n=1 Tax=Asaia bogorensis TaxID=91915 RepID=UPI000EFAE78F|nr:hypothetical protein [Asaia bogorensis]
MDENLKTVVDLPFAQRRYIAVLDDRDFDRKMKQSSFSPYTGLISEALPLFIPGNLALRAAATVGIKLSVDWIQNRAHRDPDEFNRSGLIQAVPLREANRFKFLGGCAEVGRAYAANPLQEDTYYSVETYNDDMIDHKLSELERILNGLGARSYEIIFNSDEQSAAEIGIGFQRTARLKAAAELRNARAKRYERSGTSRGRDPQLPANLVWLEREPSWQALVESRLEHGRERFRLRVNLERDLQISSKISADFKMLGLNAGADYKRKINFSLTVEGTFGE